MAIARPAALPIKVAKTPTVSAIPVDVITPRKISPFGSNETSYPRNEYSSGRIAGKRQPAATDQMMMDKKGKNIQNTKTCFLLLLKWK